MKRSLFLVCAGLLVAGGCVPFKTTMKQYRRDSVARHRLERRAEAICHCLRSSGADFPENIFTTDGCSASPDSDWGNCCVDHDIAYWCGGSRADRRAADRRLAACVEAKGHTKQWAEFMRLAVGAGGQAQSPAWWRWGYGWNGIHGYDRRSGPDDPAACFARLDIATKAADSSTP